MEQSSVASPAANDSDAAATAGNDSGGDGGSNAPYAKIEPKLCEPVGTGWTVKVVVDIGRPRVHHLNTHVGVELIIDPADPPGPEHAAVEALRRSPEFEGWVKVGQRRVVGNLCALRSRGGGGAADPSRPNRLSCAVTHALSLPLLLGIRCIFGLVP